MSAEDRLEAAVRACRWSCIECGSDRLSVEDTRMGPVPLVIHWRLPGGSWCPCTFGGVASRRASADLLDALASAGVVSQYNESCWHRRERVAA